MKVETPSTAAEYGYDTQNLRVRIKDASGDRRILLDGIEEIGEYDTTTGERIKRYDHDPSRVDALLAQKGSGGQKLNAYSDALGSVYGLVDAQGTAQARYSYDVYGARTASLENVGTDWGFTGRRFDGATGLGYYRMRYVDAGSGAFTTSDPLFLADPDYFDSASGVLLNAYVYAGANPAVFGDPMGLFFGDIIGEGQHYAISLIAEQSLMWISLALRISALRASAGECQACRDVEMLAFRRTYGNGGVKTVAGALVKDKDDGLLSYRWPRYLTYYFMGIADYNHWKNIVDDSFNLKIYAMDMLALCRTWGHRALASWYFFVSTLEPPYPQLQWKGGPPFPK